MDAKAKVVAVAWRWKFHGEDDWNVTTRKPIGDNNEPLITLTDHEAAMAELSGEVERLTDLCNERGEALGESIEREEAACDKTGLMVGHIVQADDGRKFKFLGYGNFEEVQSLTTLLTGLEALAGEWERSGDSDRDADGYAGYEGRVYDECAEKLRTLTNSAKA